MKTKSILVLFILIVSFGTVCAAQTTNAPTPQKVWSRNGQTPPAWNAPTLYVPVPHAEVGQVATPANVQYVPVQRPLAWNDGYVYRHRPYYPRSYRYGRGVGSMVSVGVISYSDGYWPSIYRPTVFGRGYDRFQLKYRWYDYDNVRPPRRGRR